MNGAATVSPIWTPNYCVCGHDYVMHSLTGNGTCSGCAKGGAGQLNVHLFTSDNEAWPLTRFPASDPARWPIAGAQNQGSFVYLIGTNIAGSTTVNFLSTLTGIVAGMTFYNMQTGTPQNSNSYTVLRVINATSLLVAAPGILASSSGQSCLFTPSLGAGMGGGQPNNGQRAG